jgi:hypothetical protein
MSFYSWIAVSSVNVVTKLWAGQPKNHVLISGKEKEFFLLLRNVHTASGVYPGSYTGGVRNQAPPSNAEGRK